MRAGFDVSPAQFIEPMLSLAVPTLPEGPEWSYEVKFDGYRTQGIKTGGCVQLRSRNGRNFNSRFAHIARALEALPDETVIDGEVIAYDSEGHPSFEVLQNHLTGKPPLHYFAFDLLVLRGKNVMSESLEHRRELLRRLVMPLLPESIRFSDTLRATAAEVIEAIRKAGLEGVVAKRRDSRYEPGRRSGAWQKMRVNKAAEFVIAGYTPGTHNFDALLVGRRDDRKLLYVAKVRAGFTPVLRESIFKQLRKLEIERCPFHNLPESRRGRWGDGVTAEDMASCRWLKPRLLATIEYLERTSTNHLRHPRFISLSGSS
jgi:bifunctional non-homologous end joining protein LigD